MKPIEADPICRLHDAVAGLPAAMEATAKVDDVGRFVAGNDAIVSTMNPFLAHLVSKDDAVADYTARSGLVTCESAIMGWTGRLIGLSLVPQTGADLVKDLLEREDVGPIVIVGPEVAMVNRLESPNPLIAVECPYSPDRETLLESTFSNLDAALEAMELDSSAPLYLVALGPRKQEYVANGLIRRRGAKRLICCGASIDYLTGKERRAPRFFRRAGLEWLWRLRQNPSKKAKIVFVYSPKGLIAFLSASVRYRHKRRSAS